MESNCDFYNPCEECICLPSCIQVYKLNIKDYTWKAISICDQCSMLYKMYFELPTYNGYNKVDEWWENNYGK